MKKRVLSVLLAAALVVVMVVPAFAESVLEHPPLPSSIGSDGQILAPLDRNATSISREFFLDFESTPHLILFTYYGQTLSESTQALTFVKLSPAMGEIHITYAKQASFLGQNVTIMKQGSARYDTVEYRYDSAANKWVYNSHKILPGSHIACAYIVNSSQLSGSATQYTKHNKVGGIPYKVLRNEDGKECVSPSYGFWLGHDGGGSVPDKPEDNINQDTNGDGKPDLNVDTDGDGKADINIDTDGDKRPDINIDTDGDNRPDINIDTDGDKRPDINIDTNGDKRPDINIDTDGDKRPDINIDTDGDGRPDINIDTNGDGRPDINIDTNGDKRPDINIDTNGDKRPNVNIDTDGDGKPDVNIDTNGDGKPDVNVDTNGDGRPDINIDTNGDGKPDTDIDTDGDGKPDQNISGGGDSGSSFPGWDDSWNNWDPFPDYKPSYNDWHLFNPWDYLNPTKPSPDIWTEYDPLEGVTIPDRMPLPDLSADDFTGGYKYHDPWDFSAFGW